MTVKLEETRGCLNFLLRRTSRIVARHYDDALRPHGLRATQFNVLSVLAQMGSTSLTELANVMAMERSALARNLKPLEREGFVTINSGNDKRTRIADVTTKGRRKLKIALPAWAAAHKAVYAILGSTEGTRLGNAARKAGDRLSRPKGD